MPRGYAPRARSAAIVLIVALVAGSALVRGGVDLVALAIAAPLAAGAFALAPRLRRGESASIPALVPGIAVAVVFVGLQLVPLPPSLLRALSPGAGSVLDEALAPIGLFPSWRPLTLDPGATALELAKAAVFTAVTAAVAILGASERRRDQLLRGLALSGVAVVAVYYGAALAGALAPRRADRHVRQHEPPRGFSTESPRGRRSGSRSGRGGRRGWDGSSRSRSP